MLTWNLENSVCAFRFKYQHSIIFQHKKWLIVTMKLFGIFLLFPLCTRFVLCLTIDSIINQPAMDESLMLAKIIGNFFTKYFSGSQIFVSMICSFSNTDQNNVMDDFYNHLFEYSTATMFDVNILNKLESSIRVNRISFNLILIDDSKSLQ